MAGIEVFVFDDLDGSRSFDAIKDNSLSDRAVYVDLNNDGKLGSSEPWSVSDSKGAARFPNLERGEYTVRLLGNNRSVVQTLPTLPADQGTWVDGLNVKKVLRVESSGLVWGVSENSLALLNSSTGQPIKSIDFGSANIIDTALQSSLNEGDVSGYVLSRNADNSQVLWKVSTAGSGTKKSIAIDVSDAKQLVTVGDRVLVLASGNLQEISIGANQQVSLKKIGVGELPSNAVVKATDSNGFAVFEDGATTNRLSLYQLRDGMGQLVGKRSFPSKVIAWEVSGDGGNIAVETADDFMILKPESGLPTKAILKDARSPIAFDSTRKLLITGTTSNPRLTGWDTFDWTANLSVLVSNGRPIAGATSSLNLDATGTRLVGTQNGALYQHNIAVATGALVHVVGNGTMRLEIGVKNNGVNRKPDLKAYNPIYVGEDGQLSLDRSTIQSNASDSDGDSLVYLIRTNPSQGLINWNQDASGIYTPAANANGQDFVTIQAYDGLDWSQPQILPIVINPVNDFPTGIGISVDSVSENPAIGEALATLQALDPDEDSDYEYRVNDSRFSVDGGVLRLVRGSINYEREPQIVLAITAIDRHNPKDSISQAITVNVRDINEPPTGISTPLNLIAPELTEGVVFGKISAIDPDSNEVYSWSVSDDRFEVVKGTLQLAVGRMLDFEAGSSVALILRGQDNLGLFEIENTLTITVTDQDDEPSRLLLTESATIRENQTGQRTIGSVSVLDPDVGEVYTFRVSDSRFEVVRGTIQLKSGESVSYVEPGFIDLTVTATSQRSGTQLSGNLRLNIEKDMTPYHNDEDPSDVDGDGFLTPLDPLIIINYINKHGIGPIEQTGEGEGTLLDLDVDCDGEVTPIDILILINKLNQQNSAKGEEEAPPSMDVESKLPVLLEAEGEGSQMFESELKPSSALQPSQVTAVSQPVTNLNDVSLASYLSDLSEDLSSRKLRRK
ncbi:MAG TPA: dockerin type I domain-containing protein [Pirellula sp.]|nr:dockerin type I domain-containing protein [Pirellula sp.]